jgi:hypothetical protein
MAEWWLGSLSRLKVGLGGGFGSSIVKARFIVCEHHPVSIAWLTWRCV